MMFISNIYTCLRKTSLNGYIKIYANNLYFLILKRIIIYKVLIFNISFHLRGRALNAVKTALEWTVIVQFILVSPEVNLMKLHGLVCCFFYRQTGVKQCLVEVVDIWSRVGGIVGFRIWLSCEESGQSSPIDAGGNVYPPSCPPLSQGPDWQVVR